MIVLARKPGQQVFIGNDIRIVVLRHSHGGLRLGIECPRHIPVVRAETAPRPEPPTPRSEARQ